MDVWKLADLQLWKIYGRLDLTFLGSRSEDPEMLKYLLESIPVLNSTARSPTSSSVANSACNYALCSPYDVTMHTGTLLKHSKIMSFLLFIHTEVYELY